MARATHELVFAMVPHKFAKKGLLVGRQQHNLAHEMVETCSRDSRAGRRQLQQVGAAFQRDLLTSFRSSQCDQDYD
eukprot:751875-Hanusia_phi.AAC.1